VPHPVDRNNQFGLVNVLGVLAPVREVAGASPENCAGNGASAGGTAQGG
jgi:hypothetical protein